MEKIWLKSYPKGIPADIEPSPFNNLNELFTRSCEQYADNQAFYQMGHTITYAQLAEQVDSFAAYLQQHFALKKGDRIALMLPNCLQYPVALFAAFRIGLIVVNVNPLYTVRELGQVLKDSRAKAIVVLNVVANTLEKVMEEVPIDHVIITGLGDLLSFPKGALLNFVVKHIKKKVPRYHLPQAIFFKRALRQGKNLKISPVTLTGEDTAFLQYTGGTTGYPKGAMLSHQNLLANLQQVAAWIAPVFRPGKEVVITPLPLYHIFSLMANCLLIVMQGGLSVLIANARDINSVVKTLSKMPFSVLTGVNSLYNALLDHPQFPTLDFSHVRIALGAGMALQEDVAKRWVAMTGKPLLEGYGLTETSPVVSINPLTLEAYNGSIGLPLPSTDVKICTEEGDDVPVGEVGELWVKGPQVMQGYWQRPEATDEVITKEGWFKTGDMAKCDAAGYLYIVDRKKDMINVSGFNVYPNEIEEVVMHHPGVKEVAVIGVPDEHSGEAVKLCIVRRNPSLTEAEVYQHCQHELTGYKRPKVIEFYDELPKSAVGKVLRRHLRT